MADLSSKKIAIISTDGFEDSELTSPKEAVEAAGATAHVIAPEAGEIEGKKGTKVSVDVTTSEANAADYDALILPGGTVNADAIRINADAVNLVKEIQGAGKPIGVICHGGWILTDADLINAGANWVDEEVVVDSGFISSRTPDDLPAFNAALVEEFAK